MARKKLPPNNPGEPVPQARSSYYVQTMALARLRAHCGRAGNDEFIDALEKRRVQFGRELKGIRVHWINVRERGFYGHLVPDDQPHHPDYEDYRGYVLVDPNLAIDAILGVLELRVCTFVRIWQLPDAVSSPDDESDRDELVPPRPPEQLGSIRPDGSGPRHKAAPDPPWPQKLCEWGVKLTMGNILVHREDAEAVFSDLRPGLKLPDVEEWEADAAFRRKYAKEQVPDAPSQKVEENKSAIDFAIIGALSSLLADDEDYQHGGSISVKAVADAARQRLERLQPGKAMSDRTARKRIKKGLIDSGLAAIGQLAREEDDERTESIDNSTGS